MNAAGFPLLSLLTFLPLVGVAIIMMVRGDEATVASNARWTALWTSLIVLALSLVLFVRFDRGEAGFQFVESVSWLPEFGVGYKVGVDGISVLFVLLSTLLTPICILSAWEAIHTRVREFMIAFLVLETMMVGMFCALDFVVFYIFFEGVLIPMYLIIGVWGGPRRVYASIKFFLYTLTGSVLMLLALLAMWHQAGTTDIQTLLHTQFPASMQTWLFLAFLASFAVKVPMWPVHTWLPDAHVEAPTAGSVILAGVLLKMGGYGFLRFSVPMLPEASAMFAPLIFALSVIAVIYTSLVALAQEDMKKLIAYSSVAHMGVVTIGIFTFNVQGIDGAMFQMLSHGIVSAALFLCVGVIYDRMHTREIARYGGLADRMPGYAVVFMVFTMGTVGLPGLSGFVGEFLVIVGSLQVSFWLALLGATGMILGAAYSLYLYRRVIFGRITRDDLRNILDMSPREWAVFAPLIVLTIWMGVYPSSFTDFFDVTVQHMSAQHTAALAHAAQLAANVVPAVGH
ncbi:NADH-quinone oxidoreductase subunit M [Acidisphaera rubrifaciens]|uniref:NADH-quinone oxidoreductase subunit M n=1 Tax=Acidisphaera rubrifaciens HS-AP3 TaxID=1231350 RepID=A0A0D6P6T9_9PROT|nr:NADH-quinone oxidoreductase subunit M [Acidisphaera rubrifaciens]GAN77480.1 NADH-quinone oxidoreductase subunit M [Acidisphaera rubrifaciens HS-AP3]